MITVVKSTPGMFLVVIWDFEKHKMLIVWYLPKITPPTNLGDRNTPVTLSFTILKSSIS